MGPLFFQLVRFSNIDISLYARTKIAQKILRLTLQDFRKKNNRKSEAKYNTGDSFSKGDIELYDVKNIKNNMLDHCAKTSIVLKQYTTYPLVQVSSPLR